MNTVVLYIIIALGVVLYFFIGHAFVEILSSPFTPKWEKVAINLFWPGVLAIIFSVILLFVLGACVLVVVVLFAILIMLIYSLITGKKIDWNAEIF